MRISTVETGITQGELKALKSTLVEACPLPLPPDSSDAAVAELHEMLLELRNFTSNLLTQNPATPLRHKGYMAGLIKSLAGSQNDAARQLRDIKKQLEEANQTIKLSLETDTVTGLFNYSFLMKTLENEIERARRYDDPLSIVLFDIDNFKKINDKYGYRIGDGVLELSATLLRQILRPSDTAGRFGSGEFLLILPKTDCDGASILAERIRSLIATTPCTESSINVTISAGVATWENHTLVDLIHEVKGNLQSAKHKRKNR